MSAHFEKDVRPLIDLINEISDQGLENELDLPSVVVIGDQSSGKSSILEAISGIQLPRGQGNERLTVTSNTICIDDKRDRIK